MKSNPLHPIIVFLCFANIANAQVSLNMDLLGQWDDNSLPLRYGAAFSDIWGYSAGGRDYAIMGSIQKIHFIDITTPSSPAHITAISGGASSLWRDIKTYGQYAYSVADEGAEGLMIFSLSGLPGSVTKVNQVTTFFQRAHNIYIDTANGRLYVAGSNTANAGIIILDIATDPVNPTLLASVSLHGGYVHDIYVENNIGYCSQGYNGLRIFDFSTPTSPAELSELTVYPQSGYNHSSWRSGNTLVFADETHGMALKVVNVDASYNMNVQGVLKSTLLAPAYTNSIPHNPFILGNYCYISYYHEGVQVFDISNPANPTQIAYYDTEPGNTTYSGYEGCWGVYPFFSSGLIIGSDMLHGLFVLQLNFGALPVEWEKVEARQMGNKIKIQWATLSETGQGSFVVERSTDGRSFWPLLTLPGAAQATTTRNEYTAYDPLPAEGSNYYRIKQIDPDGTEQYSDIVSVNIKSESPRALLVNQQINAGNALMAQLTPGNWHAIILDRSGRILSQKNIQTEGPYAMVETPALSTGLYYLSLQKKGEQEKCTFEFWVY